MSGLRFFIRQRSKSASKKTAIYVRVWNSEGLDEVAKTEYFIEPCFWSPKKQKASQKSENSSKDWLNDKLKELDDFIMEAYQLSNNKHKLDKTWLKLTIEKFHNPEKFEKYKCLISFIKVFKESCKGTKDKLTIKSYTSTQNRLTDFEAKWDRELSFSNIDLDFYRSFLEYNSTVKKILPVTIGKHIKNIKLFMAEAEEQGVKVNQAYKSKRFTKPHSDAQTIYLTDDEINRIYKLDLSKQPSYGETRDLFIIGCTTGLRFSDYTKIRRGNIKVEETGEVLLEIMPIKTNKKILIPLNTMALSIIQKYNYNLPKSITNQIFNTQIKKIGKLAKINQLIPTSKKIGKVRIDKEVPKHDLISSHSARRSFITNCFLDGIPNIDIMKLSGHQTESAYLKYLRVTQEQTAIKLAKHPRFANNTKLKIV